MFAAVEKGDAKKLAELMRQDPGFNVNMDHNGQGYTLLHDACDGDGRSAVITLLLAHPDIDVNSKTKYGETPFYYACYGFASCVRLLLKDSRVKVNEPRNDGYTLLWRASYLGHLDIIKWWIASGRDMDLGTPGDIYKTDPIGAAKNQGKTKVVTLLERFKENPRETRYSMRLELGLVDALAAEMFAVVVFVSDGLLNTKVTGVKAGAKRTRFFNIARRLPLELHMVLCYRVMGSTKEIISGKDSEAAFKYLAARI